MAEEYGLSLDAPPDEIVKNLHSRLAHIDGLRHGCKVMDDGNVVIGLVNELMLRAHTLK